MPRTGFATPTGSAASTVAAVAQAAEAQGYDSFWLTEGGGKDSISQLGCLAGLTNRIRLGTGIITTFARTPVLIAQTALGLDDLSDGRFILGLGTGHRASVETGQGQDFARPVARMADYIHIITTLLNDGHVSYQGKAVSVEGFRMAPSGRRPNVPIYIATLGGPTARLAGRVAQGVLPLMASPEGIERLREGIAQGAKEADRSPAEIDVACFIIACASTDLAAAEAEARRQVARYGSLPFYQKMLRHSGFGDEVDRFQEAQNAGNGDRLPDLVSDRLLEAVTLVGSADEWRTRLRRFRTAGVTHPVVYAASVGEDHEGSLLQAVRMLPKEELR